MKLTSILDKTKHKTLKNYENKRSSLVIPTEERPYDLKAILLSEENKKDQNPALVKEEGHEPLPPPPIAEKLATNREQTGNKPETNEAKEPLEEIKPFFLSQIVGLQKALLLCIFEDCKSNDSKISGPLTLEDFSFHTKASPAVIKTTLRRLGEKKVLSRGEFKNGRGGWTRYELAERVYQELVRDDGAYFANFRTDDITRKTGNKLVTNREQTGNNDDSFQEDYQGKPFESLPGEWKDIDITPLESIRFTKYHLLQIQKAGQLNAEVVQESINAFSFDLEHNDKKTHLKQPPLNFFMGILRKGIPYLPPQNYESPKERAWRLYTERKNRLDKEKKEKEKDAYQRAFIEWKEKLKEEDLQKIIPPNYIKDKDGLMYDAHLNVHFKDSVWPNFFPDILSFVEDDKDK